MDTSRILLMAVTQGFDFDHSKNEREEQLGLQQD